MTYKRMHTAYNMRAMSLQEVGDELGISAERVRQLEDRALRKLRQLMRDKDPEHYLTPNYDEQKA